MPVSRGSRSSASPNPPPSASPWSSMRSAFSRSSSPVCIISGKRAFRSTRLERCPTRRQMKLPDNLLRGLDPFVIMAFTIPFAIYMLTLAPSVTFFDSGEFLTAAYSLGSAHSPGYPLFLMFVKPFTWLPLGNIAFRINMATALSSSLACLGVYFLTIYLLRNEQLVENERFSAYAVKAAGLAAALAFSVTPRLWLQSNHDKPYPLL